MAQPNLVECVIHWKKKLDRNPDDEIILNVIRKLSKIPITKEILEATHIGKCIRNLSKRIDIVGENAKTVLNKWRQIFVNLEAEKNANQKSLNNDHKEKYPSKHSSMQVKSVNHHEKESSHKLKEKHKKHSSHHSSSKQSSEKQFNANNSSKSSQSFKDSKMKNSSNNNFHHLLETDIAYIPDGLENHLLDDKRKTDTSDDSQKSASSLKRKLTTEEKVEMYKNSFPKKIKLEDHSKSEEMKKHRSDEDIVNKSKSFSQNLKENSSSSHLKKEKKDKSKDKVKSEKLKSNIKIQSSDGFTASSVSFEDCLGFNDIVPMTKKKISKSQSSTKKPPSDSIKEKQKVVKKYSDKKAIDQKHVSKIFSSSKEKQSDSVAKKSTLYESSENSSPSVSVMETSFPMSQSESAFKSKKENQKKINEDVIKFTSSRKEKTVIYSGRRSCNRTFPSLTQCCYRVLIENIDILSTLGNARYKLLKPILEKCTPTQLFNIENFNPHLLDKTNELWEIHCKRDFKLLSPLENETWRDVYLRGFDEHEERLKNVTANISTSMLKATPKRQIKLAFIDSDVKPPREVLRRQAKHRLLECASIVTKPTVISKTNLKNLANTPSSSSTNQKVVAEKKEVTKTNERSHSETSNQNSSTKGNTKSAAAAIVDPTASNKDFIALSLAAKKPKVAPLMAKTLKTMKQCFRR